MGRAGSGKSRLIGRNNVNQEKTFLPSFDIILYFYKHYQQNYGSMLMDCQCNYVDIEFIQDLEWNSLQKTEA